MKTSMKGQVKWFSEEKGYGYIVPDDGKDHYFNIRDVQGASIPRNGDVVSFESSQGSKGPRATSVMITTKSQASSGSRGADDRVVCEHCGKKMVPRLITYQGEPSKSVCPFCAGTYKDFGWCFIATAVYGDYYAPEVIALRRFRDEVLEATSVGRIFISVYYRLSPPIAEFLSHRPRLAAPVRFLLNILVRRQS